LIPKIESGENFICFGKLISGGSGSEVYFGVTASSSAFNKNENRRVKIGAHKFLNLVKLHYAIFPLQFTYRSKIKAVGFSKLERFLLTGFSFTEFDFFQFPVHISVKSKIRNSKILKVFLNSRNT
jgi:hypothetical protein